MTKRRMKELDIKLINRLKKLGEENKYKEYLDLLNENLEKVEIRESGEKLLYLPKHLSEKIFLSFSDSDYTKAQNKKRLFLRKAVIDKLNWAQKLLPKGFHLLVNDAFRTEEMVLRLYKKYFKKGKEQNPKMSEKEIDIWLRNLLAMPDDPVPPGHMTGGAVDVVLADSKGKKISLIADYNIIPKEEQKFTFCPAMPNSIKKRRKILYDALKRVGFNNYFREYWHYSYGDPYWAVRRKNKTAIYGIPKKELFEKI